MLPPPSSRGAPLSRTAGARLGCSLRGVAGSLTTLYNDICSKYDALLKEYQYNRNNDTPIGQAILGPYSPGSMILNANQFDYRGNIFD